MPFITGLGNISAQKTWNNSLFLEEPIVYTDNYLKAADPDYKEFINPVAIRRMSHVIKMGIASAKLCLKDANLEMPDAIITGTGFGCIEDTEKFLLQVIDNNEEQLTPTAFMQSTHNAVNGQLAILLGCKNYNFTYCQRGFSFENALLDSMFHCADHPNTNVLLGGFDEISSKYFLVNSRIDMWKKEKINNLELLNHDTPGTIAGEFSVYFVLSDQSKENTYCKLSALETFYKPESPSELTLKFSQFLERNQISATDIDLVIYGFSGDNTEDFWLKEVQNSLFSSVSGAYFKHLCGEHYTASAWGMWLGAKMLKTQTVPAVTLLPDHKAPAKLNRILVMNNYRKKNFSAIVLEVV